MTDRTRGRCRALFRKHAALAYACARQVIRRLAGLTTLAASFGAGIVFLSAGLPGCGIGVCGDVWFLVDVTGDVRNVEGDDPLTDVLVGVELFANGNLVAVHDVDSDDAVTTQSDGAFRHSFIYSVGQCVFPLPGVSFPELPDLFPDEIAVIVKRNGCAQRMLFDVDEDNFVNPTAPDDVLELREPILVPPCEE